MILVQPWLKASRLRTLPLALSSTLLGSFLAWSDGYLHTNVLLLAVSTTVLLQVLSNFANDYGDFTKGTDAHNRIGPERMVTTGAISAPTMKRAILVLSGLTFVSGIFLVFSGLHATIGLRHLIFILLGVASIGAAITYTVGKRPYGYIGLGDIAVFIFFGLLGVSGTYYLHAGYVNWQVLLPSVSIGFLSAGVLNLNNMRDIENDRLANKKTLVVAMGSKKARFYHLFLVLGAMVAAIIFTCNTYQSYSQWLFVAAFPLFVKDIMLVLTFKNPAELNNELKHLALSTFIFSLLLGIGKVL